MVWGTTGLPVGLHDMNRLRTLGNGKRDQALDRVSRAMAGRLKNPKSQIGYLKLNCLESFLNFEPAALETVVKNQSCQISHSHVPHGSAGSDEEDKKILFLQFNILNNQRQFNPCEKEDHA